MTKIGPNQKRWLEALRSGEYRQVRGYLHTANGFCCLGVACTLFKPEDIHAVQAHGYTIETLRYEANVAVAPNFVIDALALYGDMGNRGDGDGPSLAAHNDEGKSFADIADLIEADPHMFFKEPR